MKIMKLKTPIFLIQTFWLRYSWSLLLIFISSASFSQDISYLQDKYPGQSEVVTDYIEHYHISVDKDNRLIITKDNYEELMITTDKGIGFSIAESIVFSDLQKITSFEVYTLSTVKRKQQKTNVASITERKLDRKGIFDSDVKLKVFNFANLTAGNKKVLKYNIEFADPFLLHRFMFASSRANLKRTLKISHSDAVKIDYKLFNIDVKELDIQTESRKGVTTITIHKSEPDILRRDRHAAGLMYEAPHLHFWVSEYLTKEGTVPVLGTVDKLFAYYHNFISHINQSENDKLKEFTLDLIENHKTNDAKMQTIFRWVQQNIKYVAFESGYEGFIPREAGLVFERKFGDCKDMTSIIVEMAKYAGVPDVNFTWIGSRELPYTYNELPTPAIDNHMIAAYLKDEEIIYLDATDPNVPFGMPSGFIQGKEALIAQGDNYILSLVPEISATANIISDRIHLSLDNQKIIGNGVYSSTGLIATAYRNAIGDDVRQRREFIFSLLEKGNNKFKLIDFKEIDFSDNSKPYNIIYDFELENYLISAGNETYVNLTLDKPFQNDSFEPSRVQTFDHEYLNKRQYHISLEIPSENEVLFLPENTSFSNDLMRYKFEYHTKGSKVFLDYEIEIKQTLVRPEEFSLWNESIRKLKENYLETIIIKQK